MPRIEYIIHGVRLFGGVWSASCVVCIAILFVSGWLNGDTLLVTFNESGEKWIELILVPVGSLCAVVLGVDGLYRLCQRWYAGIGKTSMSEVQ